jgi:hypothetical protein
VLLRRSGVTSHVAVHPAIKEAVVAELVFNCDRLLDEWAQLISRVAQGDQALRADALKESFKRWDCADRMLTHAVRIDRILRAPKGKDSDSSWKIRQDVAEEIGLIVNLSLDQRKNLHDARNAMEHADEKLPDFVLNNPGKALGPVSVGPEAEQGGARNYVPLRAINTLTWNCEVNGIPVNLKSLSDAVRNLKFGLPSAGVSARFTPREVLGDNAAD